MGVYGIENNGLKYRNTEKKVLKQNTEYRNRGPHQDPHLYMLRRDITLMAIQAFVERLLRLTNLQTPQWP